MTTTTAVRTCDLDGCDRPHKAKGLCSRHYNQAHYQRDPDRHRDRARRWHHDNPERAARRAARRDPEAMRAAARDYYRRHRLDYIAGSANQRAEAYGIPGRLTAEGIAARWAYFAGRCWICSSTDADTIDHVLPLGRGGPNLPANIRPACGTCNYERTWEGRRP